MKFIRYLGYLLYSYYLKGPRQRVAYFSAIATLTFITLIHIALVIVLIKGAKYFGDLFTDNRSLRYFILLLIGAPFFIFYYYIIGEKRLEQMKDSFGYEYYDKEFNHRALLFTYFILLFAGLIIGMFFHR